MAARAVTDLPDPDSPTMPSTSPRRQGEGDAADGVDDPVLRREVDLQLVDLQRCGSATRP